MAFQAPQGAKVLITGSFVDWLGSVAIRDQLIIPGVINLLFSLKDRAARYAFNSSPRRELRFTLCS